MSLQSLGPHTKCLKASSTEKFTGRPCIHGMELLAAAVLPGLTAWFAHQLGLVPWKCIGRGACQQIKTSFCAYLRASSWETEVMHTLKSLGPVQTLYPLKLYMGAPLCIPYNFYECTVIRNGWQGNEVFICVTIHQMEEQLLPCLLGF